MELDAIRRWLRGEEIDGLPEKKKDGPRLRGKSADMVVIDDPIADGGGFSGVDLEKISAKPSGRYTISMDGKDAVINFGKHKGKTLTSLAAGPDRSYLDWMLNEGFPDDLKNVIKHILKRSK